MNSLHLASPDWNLWFPPSSAHALVASRVVFFTPSSTTSVGPDASFQGAAKSSVLQPVPVHSSASLAE